MTPQPIPDCHVSEMTDQDLVEWKEKCFYRTADAHWERSLAQRAATNAEEECRRWALQLQAAQDEIHRRQQAAHPVC